MRYPMLTRAALVPAAVMLALAAPVPAHAQFGKLIKKAKHAVTSSAPADADADGTPVKFDDTTLELTNARVVAMIAGLQAKLRFVSTADGIGVAAMNERAQTLEQQLPTVDPKEENAYNTAVSDQKFCMEKTLDTLSRAHEGDQRAATMAMAMDRTRMMAMMQQVQAAMQRGDTAEARRLQLEQMGAPARAIAQKDSAEAKQRCGPVPAKPADLARFDSLNTAHEQLIERIRAVQSEADSVAAARSGMTREQFDIAKERVLSNLGRYRHGLNKTELAALDAHHDELDKLSGALYRQGASW
ncbi:MAG TPA: hypothetical protein VF166_14055 [Gemmatimonadaceae bacterium]